MNIITITDAKYMTHDGGTTNCTISATVNGEKMSIPMVAGNSHYDEILRQVEAGTLTIQEASD
mgnify:CR=1 FL=1